MSIDPRDAVANPCGATGPRTPEGKQRSSRNATKHGLYAGHDYIRDGEEEEYASTYIDLMRQLSPEGALEQTFATEIVGSTWRLRRCRMVEEDLAEISILDPMIDEQTAKSQKSVDRARAQSHNILRRCLAELRRLQTDRQIRSEMNLQDGDLPVLTDIPAVTRAAKSIEIANREPAKTQTQTLDEFEEMLGLSDAQLNRLAMLPETHSFCKTAEPAPAAPPSAPASFCKTAPNTPRNAQCPCGSGAKFKRCCGKNAPPVLQRAA